MNERHLGIVRGKLEEYAGRRVFSRFGEERRRGDIVAFSFVWLHQKRFVLELNGKTGSLRFRDCFPGIDSKSRMVRGLREFLESRTARSLPAHRRVDPARAEVRLTISKGVGSLEMAVHRNQYRYAIGKFVNLMHEVFLFINVHYPEYLHERFDLPEE